MERLVFKSKMALIAPRILSALTKSATRTHSGQTRGIAASAATTQATGTLVMCTAMILFSIGNTCVDVEFGEKTCERGICSLIILSPYQRREHCATIRMF